jgi:tetratricopeptide (TPR) repeat protein
MKNILFAFMALTLLYTCNRKQHLQNSSIPATAITDASGNPTLLGRHPKADLQLPPYNAWFDKNYSDYIIDTATIDKLKPLIKGKQFEIFMGTWCGDSRREVPRMYKILEYAGVRASNITLILVDNHDSTYKQSPQHEEKDKQIFRVPDLIVYRKGKELNRIIEFPVVSLEKDLLNILQANTYLPNYKAASWLMHTAEKITAYALLNNNSGTLERLEKLAQSSAELNALGYVWMAAGDLEKASMAFELNMALYPKEANCYDSLGELRLKQNNKLAAIELYKKALNLNPKSAHAKRMLEKLVG